MKFKIDTASIACKTTKKEFEHVLSEKFYNKLFEEDDAVYITIDSLEELMELREDAISMNPIEVRPYNTLMIGKDGNENTLLIYDSYIE